MQFALQVVSLECSFLKHSQGILGGNKPFLVMKQISRVSASVQMEWLVLSLSTLCDWKVAARPCSGSNHGILPEVQDMRMKAHDPGTAFQVLGIYRPGNGLCHYYFLRFLYEGCWIFKYRSQSCDCLEIAQELGTRTILLKLWLNENLKNAAVQVQRHDKVKNKGHTY